MGDIFLAYLIFILAQSAQLIMRNAIVQTLVTVFIFLCLIIKTQSILHSISLYEFDPKEILMA